MQMNFYQSNYDNLTLNDYSKAMTTSLSTKLSSSIDSENTTSSIQANILYKTIVYSLTIPLFILTTAGLFKIYIKLQSLYSNQTKLKSKAFYQITPCAEQVKLKQTIKNKVIVDFYGKRKNSFDKTVYNKFSGGKVSSFAQSKLDNAACNIKGCPDFRYHKCQC